ncbi:uncharacterized protein N0V89_009099 [Didymosphaeria variabile]|uniref:Ubiquitin-like modifier HUB1 n=2 Tax=Didymosphaeriaceae TaxID=221678 RepID=A0A9W8XHI2_9PLEO|nr:uncharacterized protein N0V89_009099 [Didymosphaeria variabile]KAJ4350478.1 hypothetical protein N0V89_009099 [Didymosphaeria variabile]
MPSPAPHPDRAALVPRSKSQSPARKDDAPAKDSSRARSRSRSPRRSPPRKPKSYSGLKWKKPDRSDAGDRDGRDRDDRRGGYDRDDRRRDDGHNDRGFRRDDRERRDRRDDDRRRDYRDDRDRRGKDRDSDRRRDRDRDHSDRPPRSDRDRDRDSKPPREKKPAAAPAPIASGEPMIIVTVNDRLGTKAQIPCMASDPVKVFKAMVAAKIGRPVHEIMLKRQGERPFHDQLSLADYGVSHGVQIDLELNTGD